MGGRGRGQRDDACALRLLRPRVPSASARCHAKHTWRPQEPHLTPRTSHPPSVPPPSTRAQQILHYEGMATSSSSSFAAREPPEASGSGSARRIVAQPLAPLVPARPSKKSNTKLSSNGHSHSASVKTCCAIDRWDEPCTEVVVGGHKGKVARWWCARHELEEQVVRDEFASASLPLPSPSVRRTDADWSL